MPHINTKTEISYAKYEEVERNINAIIELST